MELRTAVNAMMQEGISADQFMNVVTTYGIQGDAFLAAVACELRLAEDHIRQASGTEWAEEDAESVLELLTSCENDVCRSSVE